MLALLVFSLLVMACIILNDIRRSVIPPVAMSTMVFSKTNDSEEVPSGEDSPSAEGVRKLNGESPGPGSPEADFLDKKVDVKNSEGTPSQPSLPREESFEKEADKKIQEQEVQSEKSPSSLEEKPSEDEPARGPLPSAPLSEEGKACIFGLWRCAIFSYDFPNFVFFQKKTETEDQISRSEEVNVFCVPT